MYIPSKEATSAIFLNLKIRRPRTAETRWSWWSPHLVPAASPRVDDWANEADLGAFFGVLGRDEKNWKPPTSTNQSMRRRLLQQRDPILFDWRASLLVFEVCFSTEPHRGRIDSWFQHSKFQTRECDAVPPCVSANSMQFAIGMSRMHWDLHCTKWPPLTVHHEWWVSPFQQTSELSRCHGWLKNANQQKKGWNFNCRIGFKRVCFALDLARHWEINATKVK